MVEEEKQNVPSSVSPLSPEMEEILRDEAEESEIQAAMDAALEAGIIVTREEIVAIFKKYPEEEKNTSTD